MALEASVYQPSLAGRVIAMAGRFAVLPEVCPVAAVHLVHGSADAVIPSSYSGQAALRIAELGGTVSLRLIPELGHGIDEHMLQHVLGLIQGSAITPQE